MVWIEREKIASDVLQRLAGEYVLNGETVNVVLVGDTLRLTVADQPQCELVLTKGLLFEVKGLPGSSIEFQRDASGKVSEAVFNRPNGVYHAKRK